MRGLIGSDIFRVLRIVKAAGVEEEVQKITIAVQNGKQINQQQAGAAMIVSCVCGCGNKLAEREIWEFLADLTEHNADDLKSMELDKLLDIIEELANYISGYDLAGFFKRVSRLMQAKSLR